MMLSKLWMLRTPPVLILVAWSVVVMLAGSGLTACSHRALDVTVAPLDLPQPEKQKLPRPQPPDLTEVTWSVVTPVTVSGDYFYMGLPEKQYQALAQNQTELLRYVTELEWLVGYYEGVNKPTEPAPAE